RATPSSPSSWRRSQQAASPSPGWARTSAWRRARRCSSSSPSSEPCFSSQSRSRRAIACAPSPITGGRKSVLEIENLHVSVDGAEIIRGLSLRVPAGETHALMGPNGSGKSTLAYALSGRDGYEVTRGRAALAGVDLLALTPEERAASGLFLSFQY